MKLIAQLLKNRARVGGVSVLVLSLWLAACRQTPASPGADVAPSAGEAEESAPVVAKGMTAAEVKARLGEPLEITPIEDPAATVEQWTYRLRNEKFERMSPTRVRATPAVDPYSGNSLTVIDPEFDQEFQIIVRTFRLYLVNGVLIGWKVDDAVGKDYR